MMNLLEIQNVYELFWSLPGDPKMQMYAGIAFGVFLLLKTVSLSITGYKKFGWALLVALLCCVLDAAALAGYILSEQQLLTDFIMLFSAVLGGFILVDTIVVLICKRRSGFWDGFIGAVLGNVLFFAAGMIFYITQIF